MCLAFRKASSVHDPVELFFFGSGFFKKILLDLIRTPIRATLNSLPDSPPEVDESVLELRLAEQGLCLDNKI